MPVRNNSLMPSGSLSQHQAFLLHSAAAADSAGIAPGETPSLQPFLPPSNVRGTGAAMIVCPGGSYQALAPHEGAPIGRWLAELGIVAFVLRYRLAPHRHPVPLRDAQRAIRFVRRHAVTWGVDVRRIGILGFSAGGHLAASVATADDAGSDPLAADPLDCPASRPALQVLIYPVISLIEPTTHLLTRASLLGESPDAKQIAQLSCERRVTVETPPAFVFHSTADTCVPVGGADAYVAALRAHGVPCTYVRGEYGEHGIGLHDCWEPVCRRFLCEQNFTS